MAVRIHEGNIKQKYVVIFDEMGVPPLVAGFLLRALREARCTLRTAFGPTAAFQRAIRASHDIAISYSLRGNRRLAATADAPAAPAPAARAAAHCSLCFSKRCTEPM